MEVRKTSRGFLWKIQEITFLPQDITDFHIIFSCTNHPCTKVGNAERGSITPPAREKAKIKLRSKTPPKRQKKNKLNWRGVHKMSVLPQTINCAIFLYFLTSLVRI